MIVSQAKLHEVAADLQAVLAKEKKMEEGVKAGLRTPGWLAEAYRTKGIHYVD